MAAVEERVSSGTRGHWPALGAPLREGQDRLRPFALALPPLKAELRVPGGLLLVVVTPLQVSFEPRLL